MVGAVLCVLVRVQGMQDCSDDLLAYLSHTTQERLRDVIEKMTEISRHRVEVLKVRLTDTGGTIDSVGLV